MKQAKIFRNVLLPFTALVLSGVVAWGAPAPVASDIPGVQLINKEGSRSPLTSNAGISGKKPVARVSDQLCFVENAGQLRDQHGKARKDIAYIVKGNGINIFVGQGALHYQWSQEQESYRMDVVLQGANKNSRMIKEQKLPYYEQYYLDGQEEGIVAQAYQKVTYKDVYPNIDWVLYIASDKNNPGTPILEYDFVVHPGGKVKDIRVAYQGAVDLNIDQKGKLQIKTPMGTVTENTPYSFQSDGRTVASRFVLEGNMLGFSTGKYTGTLTIDPVLSWGTYYGGFQGELAYGITTDKWANVYLTGQTNSPTNIATTGAHQTVHGSSSDVFLVKFDSTGVRKWATYYGGSSAEEGWGLVCDESGNLYLSGITQSANFPVTTGAHQSALGGVTDAMIIKFDSSGNRKWATYYGGTQNDRFHGIAYDGVGHIYIVGSTDSETAISTPGTHQPVKTPFVGMMNDEVYLVKFDTLGKRIWGTYYGGTMSDQPSGIVCEKGGNIYIAGSTESDTGIATAGRHQLNKLGYRNGFLAKFSPEGKRIWGTYYGGEESTAIQGLSLDHKGSVYIGGTTNSDNVNNEIATAGAFKIQPGMGPKGPTEDGFLARMDTSGTRIWGTYYGGTGEQYDGINGVACDGFGDVFVAGFTESDQNIATPGSHQDTIHGTNNMFLIKFDDQGSRLWGTYHGGEGDAAFRIHCDGYGSIYLAGTTSGGSDNLVTSNGFQPVHGGTWTLDAFLVRFVDECPQVILSDIQGPDSICAGTTVQLSLPPAVRAASYAWHLPEGWTGASDSNKITILTGTHNGTISVVVKNACGDSAVQEVNMTVYNIEALITVNGFVLGTVEDYETYQWLLDGQVINNATDSTYTVTENGVYRVVVTNKEGCVDTSAAYIVTNASAIHDVPELSGQVKIYPNPVQDKVYVTAPVPVDLTVTNIAGAVIKYAPDTDYISVKELAQGVYLLRVTDRQGRLIKVEKISR